MTRYSTPLSSNSNTNSSSNSSSSPQPDFAARASISPAAGTASTSRASAARDRSTCLYRSKVCVNPRAVKPNGELHLLCSYHRKRANLNQQRVHQRRKIRARQRSGDSSESTECWELLEPYSSPCGDLTAHDLKILEILLFFSNSPTPSRQNSYESDSDSVASSTSSRLQTDDNVRGAIRS